jgi:hypothetical protein
MCLKEDACDQAAVRPAEPYPIKWGRRRECHLRITAPVRKIEITYLTGLHLKVEIVRLEFGYKP